MVGQDDFLQDAAQIVGEVGLGKVDLDAAADPRGDLRGRNANFAAPQAERIGVFVGAIVLAEKAVGLGLQEAGNNNRRLGSAGNGHLGRGFSGDLGVFELLQARRHFGDLSAQGVEFALLGVGRGAVGKQEGAGDSRDARKGAWGRERGFYVHFSPEKIIFTGFRVNWASIFQDRPSRRAGKSGKF